jgi:accessory colonization factor AcfC
MIKLFKPPEISEIKVKHEAIGKHLINMIPGCKVWHKHNFDAGAVVFYMKISEITKEFSICDQYLQDYSAIEVFDFIKQKEVIKIISTHGKVKIVMREGYPAISYR